MAPGPSQRSRPCPIANGQRSPYSACLISIPARGGSGNSAITDRNPNIRPTIEARVTGLMTSRILFPSRSTPLQKINRSIRCRQIAVTSMEPFVIGSLWGNLSDNNQTTLVSTGTTFILKDDLQDVWGEVSAGVNFFNPSASTSVFAKLDVTFGDDIDGVGGKAGMRVSW